MKNPLIHELLQTYRIATGALARERRLKEDIADLEERLRATEKNNEYLESRLKVQRESYRELDEDNSRLVTEIIGLKEMVGPFLDLIEGVLEDDRRHGELQRSILEQIFKELPRGYTFQKIDDKIAETSEPLPMEAINGDGMPIRCLSCGGFKDQYHYYMCETCFNIDIENDLGLFGELRSDWDDGKRNFPRPGKNAKELVKQ